MPSLSHMFRGENLLARVMRSVSWVLIGFGGSQVLRFASNLILARLMFPEAFGLMALVSVVIVGLALFSDVGIGPSIAHSKRGDDPVFLDTAWTIQVVRGVVLWGMTLVLALPVSQFYGEPDLALFLPIAGLSLLAAGFFPTRIETANRHLMLGRVVQLDLLSQVIGIGVMVGLAILTRSVMALVIGMVVQTLARLILSNLFLPGQRNRFRWERKAATDLIHFGKWVFLSTAFYFITSQGDRAILGKLVTLEVLGLYNIGFFLASFPNTLGQALNQRLMIPVYREKPVLEDAGNFRKLRLLRAGLTTGIMTLLLTMAFVGPGLVELLYDDRYLMAGPIITLVSVAFVPTVIGITYDQAALAAGDSRSMFIFSAARAIVQTGLFLMGVLYFGLPGGIAAIGLAALVVYPVLIWMAAKHKAWDVWHDLGFGTLGAVLGGSAIWMHREPIAQLFNILN
jgi:O-antigen/teichoic acid export membrane protein